MANSTSRSPPRPSLISRSATADRDVLDDAAAHRAHLGDEVRTLGRTPHERLDHVAVLGAEREVAGDRTGLQQRLELPRLRPSLVVRAVAGQRAHERRRPCPPGAAPRRPPRRPSGRSAWSRRPAGSRCPARPRRRRRRSAARRRRSRRRPTRSSARGRRSCPSRRSPAGTAARRRAAGRARRRAPPAAGTPARSANASVTARRPTSADRSRPASATSSVRYVLRNAMIASAPVTPAARAGRAADRVARVRPTAAASRPAAPATSDAPRSTRHAPGARAGAR